jgi:hypothetical protein
LQKAPRHPQMGAPSCCRPQVSGSISPPYLGCFSAFPHGTRPLSVRGEYLALGGGPPRFPQDSTCPAVLGVVAQGDRSLSPTGLSPSMASVFHRLRLENGFVTPRGVRGPLRLRPTTPFPPTPPGFNGGNGLGCSPFARRYSGNRISLSFPPGTEMFHFPGFASHGYSGINPSPCDDPPHQRAGFPHSGIPGSQALCASPGLFAA